MLEFAGYDVHMILLLDSAAARGICRREGVGRIRHLLAKTLCLQKLVKSGGIVVDAVAGTENRADLGTKILDRKKLVTLRIACGLVVTDEPDEEDLVSAVQPRGSMMNAAGGRVLQALVLLMNSIQTDGKRGTK